MTEPARSRSATLGAPTRAGQHFPDTRESLVQALAGTGKRSRERAIELVALVYRAPVISLLERRWILQRADAEDPGA